MSCLTIEFISYDTCAETHGNQDYNPHFGFEIFTFQPEIKENLNIIIMFYNIITCIIFYVLETRLL